MNTRSTEKKNTTENRREQLTEEKIIELTRSGQLADMIAGYYIIYRRQFAGISSRPGVDFFVFRGMINDTPPEVALKEAEKIKNRFERSYLKKQQG